MILLLLLLLLGDWGVARGLVTERGNKSNGRGGERTSIARGGRSMYTQKKKEERREEVEKRGRDREQKQ